MLHELKPGAKASCLPGRVAYQRHGIALQVEDAAQAGDHWRPAGVGVLAADWICPQ